MLAQAIVKEGYKAVTAGMNPMDLKRGVETAVAAVIEELKRRSKTVSTEAEIAQVGTISANSDASIGEMIAEAMQKVGKEGVITVEEAKGLQTEKLEVVEGMQFDQGYLSPYFITNTEKMSVELEEPYILLHEEALGLQPLLPVLEQIVQSGKPLLIIAEDVEGEALAAVGQQAARQPESRGSPSGLRRPAQGHARGHRGPDGRSADRRGSRHQARARHHRHAGQGQEGPDLQGRDHARRRRRRQGRGSRAGLARSRRRSRTPPPTTTARSCRSGWPSWPAAWR